MHSAGFSTSECFVNRHAGVYSVPLPSRFREAGSRDLGRCRGRERMAVKTTRAGRGHDFAQPLEWSSYKHKLLKNYLHVWCYKLGSFYRELAFVDTCAGAGKYEDGSDGSPVIAARYNDDV